MKKQMLIIMVWVVALIAPFSFALNASADNMQNETYAQQSMAPEGRNDTAMDSVYVKPKAPEEQSGNKPISNPYLGYSSPHHLTQQWQQHAPAQHYQEAESKPMQMAENRVTSANDNSNENAGIRSSAENTAGTTDTTVAANNPEPASNSANPSNSSNSSNNNPSDPAYNNEAKNAWMSNCMKSAAVGQAAESAEMFCECGWRHISSGELAPNLLMSTNPLDAKKGGEILESISQRCAVEVMAKQQKTK